MSKPLGYDIPSLPAILVSRGRLRRSLHARRLRALPGGGRPALPGSECRCTPRGTAVPVTNKPEPRTIAADSLAGSPAPRPSPTAPGHSPAPVRRSPCRRRPGCSVRWARQPGHLHGPPNRVCSDSPRPTRLGPAGGPRPDWARARAGAKDRDRGEGSVGGVASRMPAAAAAASRRDGARAPSPRPSWRERERKRERACVRHVVARMRLPGHGCAIAQTRKAVRRLERHSKVARAAQTRKSHVAAD